MPAIKAVFVGVVAEEGIEYSVRHEGTTPLHAATEDESGAQPSHLRHSQFEYCHASVRARKCVEVSMEVGLTEKKHYL